ncbi:MAG: DnaA/Hda family protein [Pirellulales bacterium]
MRLGILQEVAGRDMDVNQQLRSVLVDRLGRERFELWVGPHVRFERDGDTLRALSPQRFRLDRCRKSLHRELQLAACELWGGEANVEYVTSSTEMSVVETPAAPVQIEVPNPFETFKQSGTAGRFNTAGKTEKMSPARTAERVDSADRPQLKLVDDRMVSPSLAEARRKRPFSKLSEFVVGSSNRMAVQAVELMSNGWGEYSPLVITGPTGCGKTHLLEGIWSRARQENPMRRVVYLSAEQFTSYFVEALRGKGLPSFRHKYRDVDLLIIDDIQFFTGKRATIVELLYTVDHLSRQGRQLVFASDRAPQELLDLGEELINRLMSGLVCRLEPLDLETRRELVRRWAMQRQLPLSDEVAELVANESTGDARRLSGALNLLRVAQQHQQRPMGLQEARQTLGRLFPVQPRAIHLADVERVVCDAFGIEPQQLRSQGRGHAMTQPRMMAMWLARKYTRAALSEIGSYFGRRSHSTVVSAQSKVEHWIEQERVLQTGPASQSARQIAQQLEQRLSAG